MTENTCIQRSKWRVGSAWASPQSNKNLCCALSVGTTYLKPMLSGLYIWAATWENWTFAYAKTKTQISFAVTAKLISVFVFASWIVQFLCFLDPKFHVLIHLLWLCSPVYVGPGRKPRPVFWRQLSQKCFFTLSGKTLSCAFFRKERRPYFFPCLLK